MTTTEDLIDWLAENCLTFKIERNPGRVYYQTIAQYLDDCGDSGPSFIDDEDRAVCIESNQMWVVHVYPDTPVGFYDVAGSCLDTCLARLKAAIREERGSAAPA